MARPASLIAGGLIFAWALLRHIPVVAGGTFLSGEWTRAGKALVFVGGFLALAAPLPKLTTARETPHITFVNRRDQFLSAGRWCLGAFLLLTGTQHFLCTEFVASLIPAWFPGNAMIWTCFALSSADG